MIDPSYVQTMARYNQWQNENLYGVADRLSESARKLDRKAFFGSIHKTLSHLLWADKIWISRFSRTPNPGGGIAELVSLYPDWDDLKQERTTFDATINNWANTVEVDWLRSDLTWHSVAIKAEITRPTWLLVSHLFNHQTHHRGQVHCLLTQAAGRPGDTDLPFMNTA
jgi:uncharacterized damage-inducible protein DinB